MPRLPRLTRADGVVMNEIEALHTTVRRYCFERCSLIWSDPAHAVDQNFWGTHRIALLMAILADVESTLPTDFASPAALRDYLLLSGQTATIPAAIRTFP